eukprot:2725226-Amphidinium_carterae.1
MTAELALKAWSTLEAAVERATNAGKRTRLAIIHLSGQKVAEKEWLPSDQDCSVCVEWQVPADTN